MDSSNEMTPVYEALDHRANVALVVTPIRRGIASALQFKMAAQSNCVQNQLSLLPHQRR